MAAPSSSLGWLDRVRRQDGAIYAAILAALEEAIAVGELAPGERLPPQRAVAQRLGIDLTTVTRAYAAAAARGLVEGAVGRGTFVRARREAEETDVVDLTMNLPPPPLGVSLGDALRDTVAAILSRTDPAVLMAYHPGAGALGQRMAGARWLAPALGEVPAERMLVAPGAQAALAAVLSTICRPGEAVICEAATYPGFRNLAAQLGFRAVACASDAGGARPDALAAALAAEDAAAVYLVPTMQNPTATTMDARRRAEIARVADSARTWIVEDDPYSRLMDSPPPAIATFAPERTFHIATLAKCLSPGLRIAYIACPPERTEAVASALRAMALMPAPLMAAVATTWIREGVADRLLAGVRAETRARRALAAERLPQARGGAETLHVWLDLPGRGVAERLRAEAQARGLALVTAEAFAVGPDAPEGVRISLGGPGRREVLASALTKAADLLSRGAAAPRAVV